MQGDTLSDPVFVLPNLYQIEIPTPFPIGPVNVYVAYDAPADGLTLVDCGPRTWEAHAALEAALSALGHSIRDVRRILVTHAHADHYGLAGDLVADAPAGTHVFTHPFNRPALEANDEEDDRRLAFYADLLNVAGVPKDLRLSIARMRHSVGEYAAPVQVTGALNDGDRLTLAGRAWQVLHTPGHSTGLVCLYEPASHVLLSNDHLLRDISSNPLVEPPPGQAQRLRSLVEYIAQLRRISAMDITVAWPGHGEPIHDVTDLVRQREAFHARRAGRILELLDSGALTMYQIAHRLFPKLDPMNFFLAISEVLGHLELLESEGHAKPTQHDGIVLWQKH
jgi:glyoxylase-like metal-dependent hydrolase (beta-lactamase superfamily II)